MTSWTERVLKVAPVSALDVETVRFDTQKVENPEISGVAYQQGTLSGYETRKYKQSPSKDRLIKIIELQSRISHLGLDLGAIMHVATQGARELTAADGAVIELSEGDDMVYRAASGQAESQIGLRLKRGDSLSGLCVETRRTLLCSDTASDERVNTEI